MRASKIVLLWLSWLLIIWTYQAAVTARYTIQVPDRVFSWTAASTVTPTSAYLSQPFMNTQVAWDSEFYLSIALQGYDDPRIRTVPVQPTTQPPYNRPLSLNYAFFPVYPHLMRLLAMPLTWFGLEPIAAATLAGVVISSLGTLVGLFALSDLSERVGSRAIYYLLIFPTGFFLAQVYTEGLFIGLSFGCLALMRRQRWSEAAGLATVATLTRAVGVALLIPLLWSWWQENQQGKSLTKHSFARLIPQLLILLLPLFVHLIWKFSFWGRAFQIVQKGFFRCQLFDLKAACVSWGNAFLALFADNPATVVHNSIEFAALGLGALSCFLTLKRYPQISVYGLLIILVSTTCGTAWSISRYLLTVPSVFLVLGRLGESELFDRVWSLISILLLAMMTALFSFNFWTG
jgi:hypothetical protein